ncbi:glycosyltransferase family 2 protein [Pelotomaculum propionicicum]|uniref:glycosyltransferase family 2 protein n=1 Tax=Pelotomaculum propionicicum TaxID=258475 RepID=UPI003B7A15F0
MKVSLIIPTLNAEKFLPNLIPNLMKQSFSLVEIIIIDSSSDDRTVDAVKEMGCRTIVIERKNFDHGGTRNLAVRESTGDVVIFMTQDALPFDSFFVENLVAPLKDKSIAASFGRQIPRPEASPPEKFARLFNYPVKAVIKSKEDLPSLGIKTYFFSNVCSAVKRSQFEEVGGFPEHTIMNEDMLLAAKFILKGYKVAYTPAAVVWHSHNYSSLQHFNRYFDIGVFFSMNRYFFNGINNEGEGIRFLKGQLNYLLKKGQYCWIPNVIAVTVAKYAGYRLGLMEKSIPLYFKKIFSMNRVFWNDVNSTEDI